MQVDYSGERWVLKTPVHIFTLKTLFAEYPDAFVVWTHRNPMDVIGSGASLACTLHSAFSDQIDPIEVGNCEAEYFAEMLQRGMAQRAELPPEQQARIFDFNFVNAVSDPIGSIEKVYERFGFELTDDARQRMQNYIDNRPKDLHGKHTYKLEDFGLSKEKHGHLFAEYCEQFSDYI